MARGKKRQGESNGKAQNKLGAVRTVMERSPTAGAGEIRSAVKEEFNIELSPKMASNYRYMVLKERGKAGRGTKPKAAATTAAPAAAPARARAYDQSGLDDLLQAASKLGWRRVKQVVDDIIGAPA
jgi:hypothetical protein